MVNQTNNIIGHSMGGNVALQLVEMAPHLAKRPRFMGITGRVEDPKTREETLINGVFYKPLSAQS